MYPNSDNFLEADVSWTFALTGSMKGKSFSSEHDLTIILIIFILTEREDEVKSGTEQAGSRTTALTTVFDAQILFSFPM